MRRSEIYIGALSGTSVDSLDIAAWDFSTPEKIALLASSKVLIESSLKNHILTLSTSGTCHFKEFGQLDKQLGLLFADGVVDLLEKAALSPKDIIAIGSHGQTVWHEPNLLFPFSIQIGDPNVIAQKTGIVTVADFRRADLALGGQGAPLVPAFHHWLFHTKLQNRIILNLGGISNISVLFSDHAKSLLGYDTGPGNALLDAWTQYHLGLPFDQDGEFAKKGTTNHLLLKKLLADSYFKKPYPKSTGKDTFNLAWLSKFDVAHLNPEDVQATLVSLTAISIREEIMKHVDSGAVYTCGGGSLNPVLMQAIRQALGNAFKVQTTSLLNLDPEFVESALFAWLARERLNQRPITLSTVTGCTHDTLLGAIYAPKNITSVC
ncbi:MAG TPA: anhydro-N-acetylmuramic acid kinase [Gammaproteobacteria bacterium]|nr:anhydro-N-acetylmuramic acid kinase [Gammaproteobacteria bacterium]